MPKKLLDFAAQLSLSFSQLQAEKLLAYARCVWEKKELLNLTSVADFDEIITRHLCDGLAAASYLQSQHKTFTSLADAGAGCGYIGFSLAAAFPSAQVTLVESIERRCKFMNWAALQTGFNNIRVQNIRLGQAVAGPFEAVTERAMGPLETILPLCTAPLVPGGIFMAFQTQLQHPLPLCSSVHFLQAHAYTLPGETAQRHLAVYQKDEE